MSFDDAVERALLLFWERGYDRTSLSDLSRAIGVGPSSIYNTFGSKEELFRQAVARYVQTHAAPPLGVLDGEPLGAEELVRSLLGGLARLYASDDTPLGCAIFQGAGGASHAGPAAAITREAKASVMKAIEERLEQLARAEEPLAASPLVLSRFVMATLAGISQLACDGTPVAELLEVAEHTARSCVVRPGGPSQRSSVR